MDQMRDEPRIFRHRVLREVRNAGKDKHDKKHLYHAPAWRTPLYATAIAVVLLLGFLVTHSSVEIQSRVADMPIRTIVISLCFLLHAPMQFLPLLAPHLNLGVALCQSGLPWEWHLSYAVIVAGGQPLLSGLGLKGISVEKGKCGITGLPFEFYAYCSSLLVAFDQYSDSASVTLAFSCGWDKAWIMLSVLVISYILQGALGFWYSGSEGLLASLCGANTEIIAMKETIETRKSHAICSVTKLLTEILPQSILSVIFAWEVKPNPFVYVSIGVSLAMGLKSFHSGLQYFLGNSTSNPAAIE